MNSTETQACFQALDLPPASPAFLADWNASATQTVSYDPAYIAAQAGYLEFPDDVIRMLCDCASELGDADRRLMQHMVYKIKQASGDLYFYPLDGDNCRPDNRLLNILVFLQLIDHVRQEHQQYGISEAVTRATLGDILIWINDYKKKTGHYGLAQCGWLQRHMMLGLFKLGRLQFEHSVLNDPIQVYRHRQSGEVLIACRAGEQLCSDGLFASANSNGISHGETQWIEDGHQISATIFDPETGHARNAAYTFNGDDYELLLSPGDMILSVHIDASGPMTPAACRDSLLQAMPFYQQHFPDIQPRAFYCSSWLLDTNFKQYLQETSNIIQFQKFWHIYARPKTGDHEFFMRVWGRDKDAVDVNSAEQDTSLQRAVISHIKLGGRWNDMGGVLFAAELQ